MKHLVKGLIGLLLLGSIAGFVASVALAFRLRQDAPPPPDEASDEVDLVAAFDRLDYHSTATHFVGGRIDCVFGGGVVDLRDATVAEGGARLEVRGIFGGAQFLVPDDWRVTVRSIGIFGGVGDARPARDRPVDAPQLEIDAFSAFGGFGIIAHVD